MKPLTIIRSGYLTPLQIWADWPSGFAASPKSSGEARPVAVLFSEDGLRKQGITSIADWTPQDSPASGSTLIFIVAHDSREAAAQHWKEFAEDPEWQKAAKASQAEGPIAGKVESTFMVPTDFSPLK